MKSKTGQGFERVVQPYLEFASKGKMCRFTGLELLDIWRYFRHTWANPYQSVPGRSMVFLIRDAAAPFHAIMGIGALSSAAVKMKARDEFIGWEAEQVVQELEQKPWPRAMNWLRESVYELIGGIYLTDLLEDGLLQPKDLRKPSAELVERLNRESEKQRELHQKLMARGDYKKNIPADAEDAEANWEEQARTPLFRSKRAGELAALFSIKQVFEGVIGGGSNAIKELLSSNVGREAAIQLVRRIKAMRVGTAIADLTVCGAVPPYHAIIGGKLAAMLAASPEMIAAYRQRYSRSASVIASSMAGRTIQRPADLVFLGTTSLYGKRPCQYDRVSIPVEVVGGLGSETIRYEYIDSTEGWGTFQFGKATTRSVAEFVRAQRNGVQVNYVFGEGANPKLRALRDGLAMLGFDQETLLNHGMGRLIYGVKLAANVRDYLLGIDKRPKYLMGRKDAQKSTEGIGRWWLGRWVTKRLARPETLTEIERHTLVHPITHGARVQLPDEDLWQTKLF